MRSWLEVQWLSDSEEAFELQRTHLIRCANLIHPKGTRYKITFGVGVPYGLVRYMGLYANHELFTDEYFTCVRYSYTEMVFDEHQEIFLVECGETTGERVLMDDESLGVYDCGDRCAAEIRAR